MTFIFFLLVPWFVLSLCVGWIAKVQGYSGIAAFLLSLIISPLVALIIYLVMGKNEAGLKLQAERENQPSSAVALFATLALVAAGFFAVVFLRRAEVAAESKLEVAVAPSTFELPAAVTLQQPVTVTAEFGNLTLPQGTRVRLISAQPEILRVQHATGIADIPRSSTDFASR
jgi:hypothetical protein